MTRPLGFNRYVAAVQARERRLARHQRYNTSVKGWWRNRHYETTAKARARKLRYEAEVRPGSRSSKAPGAYQLETMGGIRWTNHLSIEERRTLTRILRA
jgi:hypothetical protein